MKILIVLLITLWTQVAFAEAEIRTWRALGGFKTDASFVRYDAGTVYLQKTDGSQIAVRIERLVEQDRAAVLELAGENARGAIPAGQIQKPTGRRELTWQELVRGELWPAQMDENVKNALTGLRRSWSHAETEYFIIHYQEVGFAKQVARMADFQFQYIAADLPGFKERVSEKSHIVVVRNQEEWKMFLKNADSAPEWAGAYVHGMIMYLYDTDNSKANANILAHEMSHLVLNRFFRLPPPLWLNEGLAEWYGNLGHSAFKGQKVDVERGLGKQENPFPVSAITGLKEYPKDTQEVNRFYATSQQLVGMLMLRKDQPAFVQFLQAITVEGKSFMAPLAEVYDLGDLNAFQKAFDDFLD